MNVLYRCSSDEPLTHFKWTTFLLTQVIALLLLGILLPLLFLPLLFPWQRFLLLGFVFAVNISTFAAPISTNLPSVCIKDELSNKCERNWTSVFLCWGGGRVEYTSPAHQMSRLMHAFTHTCHMWRNWLKIAIFATTIWVSIKDSLGMAYFMITFERTHTGSSTLNLDWMNENDAL